jgi:hypothetical protein
VIIQQSTTAGTAYAMLVATPGNGISFQYGYNSSAGGGTYSFPDAWVRLVRSGSTITAYTSADGSTWTQVGVATITFTDPLTAGLIVCSHSAGQLGTATFDNVSV